MHAKRPEMDMRGKSARIVFGARGELAGPLPSKVLRGNLTMRSLPALLTFQTKRPLRYPAIDPSVLLPFTKWDVAPIGSGDVR